MIVTRDCDTLADLIWFESRINNRSTMKSSLGIPIGFLLASAMCVRSSTAKTIDLDPESNWFKTLSGPSVNPGDEIVLHAGIYSDSRRLEISQRGSKDKPIVIRASDGARVIIRRPDARQNSINLLGCQFLILRGIEITGGSSGIRIGGKDGHAAKFITLENLHIHHIGGVAVTANFSGETYESMIFRGNHIHHTAGHGEAFYLGSNNAEDGSTTGYIYNSIIENNYIHDRRGDSKDVGAYKFNASGNPGWKITAGFKESEVVQH